MWLFTQLFIVKFCWRPWFFPSALDGFLATVWLVPLHRLFATRLEQAPRLQRTRHRYRACLIHWQTLALPCWRWKRGGANVLVLGEHPSGPAPARFLVAFGGEQNWLAGCGKEPRPARQIKLASKPNTPLVVFQEFCALCNIWFRCYLSRFWRPRDILAEPCRKVYRSWCVSRTSRDIIRIRSGWQ